MANQNFSGFIWGFWPLAGFEAIKPYKSHPPNMFHALNTGENGRVSRGILGGNTLVSNRRMPVNQPKDWRVEQMNLCLSYEVMIASVKEKSKMLAQVSWKIKRIKKTVLRFLANMRSFNLFHIFASIITPSKVRKSDGKNIKHSLFWMIDRIPSSLTGSRTADFVTEQAVFHVESFMIWGDLLQWPKIQYLQETIVVFNGL